MKFSQLRKKVWEANKRLADSGLVILTWGNASAIDRRHDLVAIKPSGVSYEAMKPADIVIMDLSGKVIDGKLRPSVDSPTHLELYREFPSIFGICHTHSLHATAFAQAGRSIRCLGTTHADHSYGKIPLVRGLKKKEMAEYELNTGRLIIKLFKNRKLSPDHVPGCLLHHHGIFTWGKDVDKAVEHSEIVEFLAKVNTETYRLNHRIRRIPGHILETHFQRKHGKNKYYGQEK